MNSISSSLATKIALTILLLCCCCYYSSVQAFNNNNNNNNNNSMLLSRNNAVGLGRYKSSEVPRFLFGKTADADATTTATATTATPMTTTTTTKDKNKKGFLGRFRKKKNVIQDEIQIGGTLPDIDVGVIGMTGDDNDNHVVSIKELFGGGEGYEGGEEEEEETTTKSKTIQILVGMPGAYTPSCTNVHLPGFKNSLSKLQHLGVDTIAVVTTNDRFVNEAWGNDLGIISTDEKDDDIDNDDDTSLTTTDDGSDNGVEENSIIMLSDGDAELVRAIGLAEDMGFGVGIRSKRFALILHDGIVTTVLTDDGMDECENTTADKLVEILTPEDQERKGIDNDSNSFDFSSLSEEQQQQILTVGGGLVLAMALFSMVTGNEVSGSSSSVASSAAATAIGSSSGPSLLQLYGSTKF